MSDQKQNSKFSMQHIYTDDISLEVKKPIYALDQSQQLERDVNYSLDHKTEGDNYNVFFTATINVQHNKETVLICEVKQAGHFEIKGFDKDALSMILKAECPMILFPFVREKVMSLIVSAGYPQLFLEPVNFHAQFSAQQAESQ